MQFVVPNSHGGRLREFNRCHEPGGSEAGGHFAHRGTGNCSGSPASFEDRLRSTAVTPSTWADRDGGVQNPYWGRDRAMPATEDLDRLIVTAMDAGVDRKLIAQLIGSSRADDSVDHGLLQDVLAAVAAKRK